MQKIKQHIWAATATAISIYFSFVLAVGIISGYLGTKLFRRKICGKSIIVPLGKLKLHFHHWIMGGLVLAGIWLFGSFHGCPKFVLGGIGGIIVEDFKDMYQPLLTLLKRGSKKNDK